MGFKRNPQTGEMLGDFIVVKATITNIRHDFNKPPWYYACPSEDCKKKVTTGHGGDDFWCEKCNKTYPAFDCRYIMSLQAADATSATWLNAFHEQGVAILGVAAKDLLTATQAGDEASFNRVFEEAMFRPWLFRVKVKAEMQQEEMKARCNIVACQPIDIRQEALFMMQEIERMTA